MITGANKVREWEAPLAGKFLAVSDFSLCPDIYRNQQRHACIIKNIEIGL